MKRFVDVALVIGIAAAAFAGLVDALISGEGDFAAVFSVVLVLSLISVLRCIGAPRTVAVRSDLYRWYASRANAGGEGVESVVARALASYRAGLTGAAEQGSSGSS